jgi:hypothetical protein
MSFNRVRTAGLWIDGSTFGSAEIEQIDANLANALDMLDGGAYAPQSSITVGGAPGVFWEFAIPASFDDRVDVFGSFAAYSDVFLGGDGTESIVANGHVDLLGVITVGASGADAFTIEAFTTYNDLVTHNGAVYYYDNVTFAHGFDASGTILMHDGSVVIGDSGADALTVNAFTTFNDIEIHNGSAYFYGTPTFATPIEFSGTGKVKWRTKSISVTGNQTVVAANYDTVYIGPGTMANLNSITIDDTGAEDGMRIEFANDDTGANIEVRTPAGSSLYLLNQPGSRHDVAYQRIAGTWRIVRYAKD